MNDNLTDELDIAAANTERSRDVSVAAIRQAASEIPVGEPGECQKCGDDSLRLVGKACARCRDRYKLP